MTAAFSAVLACQRPLWAASHPGDLSPGDLSPAASGGSPPVLLLGVPSVGPCPCADVLQAASFSRSVALAVLYVKISGCWALTIPKWRPARPGGEKAQLSRA